MKTTICNSTSFKPFDITVTVETEDEALALRAIFNHVVGYGAVTSVIEDCGDQYKHKITRNSINEVASDLYCTIADATNEYVK